MSGTILHRMARRRQGNPFLLALGERVRTLRARRGLTRKAVSAASGVSERHLANLEYGTGNASILVLQQVASALHCSLAELLGDVTTTLAGMAADPRAAGATAATPSCAAPASRSASCSATRAGDPARSRRIALVGLRGAGKSTLGQMLADDLDVPFVELSREIEKFAGCSIARDPRPLRHQRLPPLRAPRARRDGADLQPRR